MSAIVFVPQQLRNYTGGATKIVASGSSVDDVLSDVNSRFPGIRFRIVDEQSRIREHVRIFVDGERVRELDVKIRSRSEVHIFGALSGG